MFNWFEKKYGSKDSINLKRPEILAKFIEDTVQELESRIKTPQELYDFVIEDICGASQGNDTALELVKFSGLYEVEYDGALNKTSTMDREGSALEYMNNTISSQLINQLGLESGIIVRCTIVKRFISKFKNELDNIRLDIAKHQLATANSRHITRRKNNEWQEVINSFNGKLKAKSLINLITRDSFSDEGFFFDIATDIDHYSSCNSSIPDEYLMPLLYALRLSYAGMFAQGIYKKDYFDQAHMLFYNKMSQISQTMSKEESIEFQEESLTKALEWISHHYHEVQRRTSSMFVTAASMNFSLQHALTTGVESLEKDNFSENLYLDTLNPEFCTNFYTMGGWIPNEGFKELIEKSYKFMLNPLINQYLLLLRSRFEASRHS